MNWDVLIFTFVSGMLLVLVPALWLSRRKSTATTSVVEWLDRMELSGVALISKLVVLVAPVPVAITTQIHAKNYLPIGEEGAWILAFVVEGLGYAAAYRLLQFIQYNKNLEAQRQIKMVQYMNADEERIKKAEERLKIDREKSNAPVKGPAIVYAVYLIVVIIFNVLPEMFGTDSEWWKVAMNVCVALLSAPAAYLGAINAVHTEQKANANQTNTKPNSTPNEQPKAEQPNTSPNEQPNNRTPNNRTPNTIPQPSNKQQFKPFPNTEQTGKGARIEQVAQTLEAELQRPPSVREVQQKLREQDGVDHGWSTSTINTHLKREE